MTGQCGPKTTCTANTVKRIGKCMAGVSRKRAGGGKYCNSDKVRGEGRGVANNSNKVRGEVGGGGGRAAEKDDIYTLYSKSVRKVVITKMCSAPGYILRLWSRDRIRHLSQ